MADPPPSPSTVPTSLADRLLRATTPRQVAEVLIHDGAPPASAGACILWSINWPHAVESIPAESGSHVIAAAMAAVQAAREGGPGCPVARVLCDKDSSVAVLHDPQADGAATAVDLVGARMAEVLAIQHLHGALAQLAQTEKLQRALFAIADMSASDLDMPDMLRGLHHIVGELMYAENFYIALYDPIPDSIRFLYFIDSVDEENPASEYDFPLDRIKHGPTWWMIRERKPLMGTDEQLQLQIPGPLGIHGADSNDWLGVPMLREGHVRGVLVVQSYRPDMRFGDADMALLAFVAEHILTALERKQGQTELERRVEERTHELAQTNRDLEREVRERERGERLQLALYRIAALASGDETGEAFYAQIRDIVSSLLNVDNFYVALLSEDDASISFPYVVDERDTDWSTRPLSRGLTEFVLRTGRTQMVDTHRAGLLTSTGILDAHNVGASALQWVGVPLMVAEKSIGVLAVQSYRDGHAYADADAELLGFVANQLANGLQRRSEIARRERGEHLKSALYQIAALAATDESSDRFFAHVHALMSELINADNFYLALLSQDGRSLEFAYWVDQHHPHPAPRPLGRGLTEYTLRRGCTQLLNGSHAARNLVESGEIGSEYLDSPTHSWLGAPLIGSDGMLGVVVVQSYTDHVRYSERNAELLTFVSSQLASSILRRRAADALHTSYLRLEERVHERTAELRKQIAVREEVEAQLQHQVMHDSLTGLPNRLYLRDRLDRAIAGAHRNPDRSFALLYLDVDRFKVINDNLGHLVGDRVLKEVSRRLGDCVRDPDVVARLSGDEFALLLEDAPIPQAACQVAQRVLDMLQQPLLIDGQDLRPTASVGVAIGNGHYLTADELLRDADIALYRAKSGGRNRYVLFDESLQRTAMNVLSLELELRAALAAKQFEPWFQPLVNLATGRVVGYEALVRWNHPQRGVLLPGEFLGVAEDGGQIEAIDWQMYRMACSAGAELVRDGGYITINVSPRHFQNEDFGARLLAVAADAGFDPAKLRVEVTEGTLLGDPTMVAKALHRLRDAGIHAALDDFGTGYSSLGYVHQFPLKMIKIDRSFVRPLGHEESPRSLAVIGAILALTHSLGLEPLAEGIETEQQHSTLLDMGCTHGQGYLFGKPHPAAYWLNKKIAIRETTAD